MSTDVLLVEDTPSLQSYYAAVLRREGWEVAVADTGAAARRMLARLHPRAVVLDLMLPDADGVEVMREGLERQPQTRYVIVTADTSVHRAVEAMRGGASEFLVKPFEEARLTSAVREILTRPARPEPPAPSLDDKALRGFIGSSEVMAQVYDTIRSVSRSMATIFISGESGTGKELCAQAIHRASSRAAGPFVPLNCGAISPELLDSEVFGHLKGAFPGAVSDKPGAAVLADGGTLFLDEVCDLSPPLQIKLLRFLQTSAVQPVGAAEPQKVDVRIISATNRDPLEMVRQGRLREDLYYRLYVVPIHLPPLRERGEDVIEIAETLLARFSDEEGREFQGLSEEAKAVMRRYAWPGNVRQLSNVLWNIVITNEGPFVTAEMLPPELFGLDPRRARSPQPAPPTDRFAGMTLAEIEREAIEDAIARSAGSVPRAARILDVAPSTIYRKRESWNRRS